MNLNPLQSYRLRQRLLPLRAALHCHPRTLAVALAILLLALSALYLASSRRINYARRVTVYLINEQTGDLTEGSMVDVPPIATTPDRGELVQAIFYSCGNCDHRKLAYLRKYTSTGKQQLTDAIRSAPGGAPDMNTMMALDQEMLVRLPDPASPWVPLPSPAGQRIIAPPPCDPGAPPHICYPGRDITLP